MPVDRVTPSRILASLMRTTFWRQHEARYRRILADQMRQAARRIRAGVSAVDEGMLVGWRKSFAEEGEAFAYPVIEDARKRTAQQLGKKRVGKSKAEDYTDIEEAIGMGDADDFILPARRAHVEEYLRSTSRIETSTSSKRIGALVNRGRADGLTPRQIARALETEGLASTRLRATMLSRTLGIWANNEGAVEQYQAEQVPAMAWMTTVDDVSCGACVQLDGRIVRVGDPFVSSDETLNGVAGADSMTAPWDITQPALHPNCRCWLVPVVDEAQVPAIRQAGEELRADFIARWESGEIQEDRARRAALLESRREAG